MNSHKRSMLLARSGVLLIVNSVLLIVVAVMSITQRIELDELKKHPTYHCDGSATMGYAVPGTPEAAACWIKGGKK